MATVKVLLRESVRNLGRVGDVVEVAAGYARNYLIPHHVAVEPTPKNLKEVEERRKEIEKLEKERRSAQEATIKKLAGVEVTLQRKTNEQGHLFGSVTATDIAKALEAQGYGVEAADINLPGRLDQVNTYQVVVRFAEDLSVDVKVWVAPDAESKALIEAHQKNLAEEQKASS